MTYAANQPRYIPVDELLDRPRFRVLRMLRFFDWASVHDLMVAIDETHRAAQQAINRALALGVQAGHIVRDASSLPHLYRITDAGRAHLAEMIARGSVTEISANQNKGTK